MAVAVDVIVVWRGGGAQVGSGGVVGRARIECGFTSRGFTNTVGPDLDAFGLGSAGSPGQLLVDVMDEVV